jgi:hypothetical protein
MAGESAVSKKKLSSKLYLLVHFPKHMQNHMFRKVDGGHVHESESPVQKARFRKPIAACCSSKSAMVLTYGCLLLFPESSMLSSSEEPITQRHEAESPVS